MISFLATVLAGLLGAPLQQQSSIVPKLVERIRTDLSEVDRSLQEAADADSAHDSLATTREAHVHAIADLEELIHQFKYHRGQGS